MNATLTLSFDDLKAIKDGKFEKPVKDDGRGTSPTKRDQSPTRSNSPDRLSAKAESTMTDKPSELGIAFTHLFEDEEKVTERLRSTKIVKRKCNQTKNLKISPDAFEKVLNLTTPSGIDQYKIEVVDLPFSKQMHPQRAHSVFLMNTTTVVQELHTNNAVFYSKGTAIRTLKGLAPSLPMQLSDELFEVKPPTSNATFLWRCGPNSVAIVNVESTEEPKVIDKFWDDTGKGMDQVEPITLVMNIKPEKVLGLALVGKQSYLRTFDLEKGKPRNFDFGEYQKELEIPTADFQVTSIDKSMRTNLFFAAIQTPKGARIVQVKIAKEGLSAASSLVIPVDDLKQIGRITSIQTEKIDYLLCCGMASLVVVKAKDKSIAIVHTFSNIFPTMVAEACLVRNKIFAVSPDSAYITEIVSTTLGGDGPEIEEISYEKYNITKIPLPPGHFEKLDINKKGSVLYMVGKGIVAVSDPELLKPVVAKPVQEAKQFLLVKTLKNGNFIVQECRSYDIVELNSQFKEMRRLKGSPGVALENEAMRGSRHSHDEQTLPLIRGLCHLSLITMRDFSVKEVRDFFGKETESDLLPLLCLSSSTGDKAFGAALCQDAVRLCYWERSSSPKYTPLKELFPRFGMVLSADVSLDDSVLFVGGSTDFDLEKGQAILQAVNFAKKLSYISDMRIDERSNRYVSKIRRIDKTNRFFAATIDSIYVYEFKNRKFYKLSVILNVCKGIDSIMDIVIYKNNIYALAAGDSEISRVEFASF